MLSAMGKYADIGDGPRNPRDWPILWWNWSFHHVFFSYSTVQLLCVWQGLTHPKSRVLRLSVCDSFPVLKTAGFHGFPQGNGQSPTKTVDLPARNLHWNGRFPSHRHVDTGVYYLILFVYNGIESISLVKMWVCLKWCWFTYFKAKINPTIIG